MVRYRKYKRKQVGTIVGEINQLHILKYCLFKIALNIISETNARHKRCN
jgi:hypothetical protein